VASPTLEPLRLESFREEPSSADGSPLH